jgi:hypothetical protein
MKETLKKINSNKKNYHSKHSNTIFVHLPMFRKSLFCITSALLIGHTDISAQSQIGKDQLTGRLNAVSTMVPFLTISPDSRSAAMGDVGVALFNPDANSSAWNNANLTFAEKKTGFSLSYAPWLRQLVDDVGFSYFSGYSKIGKNSAVSGSFRYFSLGNINFTDFEGTPTGNFNPNEFALDVGYATKFSEKFAMGVNLRYIYSNLAGSGVRNGIDYTAGTSVAGDINLIYRDEIKISGKKHRFNLGLNIQNIGAKMTYSSEEKRDFIPTNLKFGVGYKYEIDDHNELFIYADVNKLLVPTNPVVIRKMDNSGDSIDPNTNQVAIIGMNKNVGVIQGMVQSFYDAPGGAAEELREWTPSAGFEYIYEKMFALRGGMFYEARTKGGRQYMTLGMGLKFESLTLDAAYLIPFASRHPLQNQMRFSLLFDIASLTEDK